MPKKFFLFSFIYFAFVLKTAFIFAQENSGNSGGIVSVKNTFEQYILALKGKDGPKASDLVTQSTLDYYAYLVGLALKSNYEKTKQLSLIDKMAVLQFRASLSKKQLQKFGGKEIFIYAVQKGWVATDLSYDKIEGIKILGNMATADVTVDGTKVPFSMRFEKGEDGSWKFDLVSLIENTKTMLETAFGEMAREEKTTIDDLLVKTIEETTNKNLSLKIWEGPL